MIVPFPSSPFSPSRRISALLLQLLIPHPFRAPGSFQQAPSLLNGAQRLQRAEPTLENSGSSMALEARPDRGIQKDVQLSSLLRDGSGSEFQAPCR